MMVRNPISSCKLAVFSANLLALLTLCPGCSSNKVDLNNADPASESLDGKTTTDNVEGKEKADAKKPPEIKPPDSGLLSMQATMNPILPQNDVYLGDWRIFIFGLDDVARKNTGFNYSVSTLTGAAHFVLPKGLLPYPVVLSAYNNVAPFACDNEKTDANMHECKRFEIFVPPFCYDKALWVIGPLEDAVWRYYRRAAMRHGAPWNPNLVDCATWIANLEALYLTDTISEEMEEVTIFQGFHDEVLNKAFRENQSLLVSTSLPICMAEERHNGGSMDSGEEVDLPFVLGKDVTPCSSEESCVGIDTIEIGKNGIVNDICGIALTGNLAVNSANFLPDLNNRLKSQDFMGVVSKQIDTQPKLQVTVYNTQLGNGRELDSDIYKDACALTSVIQFDNEKDNDRDLVANGTGVTFSNLFGDTNNTEVFLTSDGDKIVDDTDFWAIFFRNTDHDCKQQVMAVELLGHRQEDFRDNLFMKYDTNTEDLFLGLRADYELEAAEDSGDTAFLSYTIHMWDGSTEQSRRLLRQQFAACYLAADLWAVQFFRVNDTEYIRDLVNGDCVHDCPLEFAEFAVRSQCFSNSRANQRWQNMDAGLYSMNSIKNVAGNIVVPPGWLGPDLDFEISVQKFDESVFKGPRTIRRTNNSGQLMVEMPTLVEGDRVLIKAQDSCCDEYDLALPCVPQFTSIVGPLGPPQQPPPPPAGITSGPVGPPLL